MSDLLIKNTTILTVNPDREVIENGSIAIKEDKIIDIGKEEEVEGKYSFDRVIDGNNYVTMPGLVNCHIHLPHMLMRGIKDDVEVMDKLSNYIWPIEGNYDEEDAQASSLLGLLDMIKSGTTSFISTGLQARYGIDRILENVRKSGLRGVSRYIMEDVDYATKSSAIHEGLSETREESMEDLWRLFDRWNGAGDGRIEVWPSPRSVGAVLRRLCGRFPSLQMGMVLVLPPIGQKLRIMSIMRGGVWNEHE